MKFTDRWYYAVRKGRVSSVEVSHCMKTYLLAYSSSEPMRPKEISKETYCWAPALQKFHSL